MTLGEALRLVSTLAAAFPKQELHPTTLEIYARDLLDLDGILAARAIDQVRRESRFFPTIAEIREAAAELSLNAPTSMQAWEQAWRLPAGERHPLVDRARRMVGDSWDWRQGETDRLRPAFLGAYKEVRSEAIREIQAALPPARAMIEESKSIQPRPIMQRVLARMSGAALLPPTETEKGDAIRVLEAGATIPEDPASDLLYREAELILRDHGD